MSTGGEVDVTDCNPGPLPDVSYPLKVIYCGECSMPLEYCEFSGITEKCRKWGEEHAPEALNGLEITGDSSEDKKHQKRGGKGIVKAEKKKPVIDTKITVQREPRGKKSVTVVKGLAVFDIDLKQASKLFSQKFACGSSVTGADEIVIQGDVKDDLFDIIPSKWPQVTEDMIDDLGDKKR
ncbi:density-regulated protein DRP1 [Dictyocaulus viviparus]|uniref:Density-regulated protein n=1 Tax=Dictyocaulus viviparus TaxID=29172 RepID=A0A0D8YEP9_DICVI|nr:density-regulated protein DRP1 [Dictyocaulus viviparus]